jgi:DNA-binding cell septation regulator SpoVG
MAITDVRVFMNKNGGKIKANGDFVVDNLVRVKFNVCEGPEGLFIGLPSERYEKDGETKWSKKVDWVNKDVGASATQELLAVYNKYASGGGKPATTKKTPTKTEDNIPF